MIKYKKLYLPITVLGFLIIKLIFGGMLLHMKRSAFLEPVFDSTPALAGDADAGAGKEEKPASAPNNLPPVSMDRQDVGKKLEILERKRAEIEMERGMLENEREKLGKLKEEIEAKIVKLAEIRAGLQRKLDEQKMVRDAKTKHLIKIYTTMAPKKAAALIEKLDMKVILGLFSAMKGEHVGAILPYVSAEKAAKISELLANRSS